MHFSSPSRFYYNALCVGRSGVQLAAQNAGVVCHPVLDFIDPFDVNAVAVVTATESIAPVLPSGS